MEFFRTKQGGVDLGVEESFRQIPMSLPPASGGLHQVRPVRSV